MFGDHSNCNTSFCKYQQSQTREEKEEEEKEEEEKEKEEEEVHDRMDYQDAGDHLTLADHISDLMAAETDNEVDTTLEDESSAQSGFSQSLEHLSDSLYHSDGVWRLPRCTSTTINQQPYQRVQE